jgi:hypothetical protein
MTHYACDLEQLIIDKNTHEVAFNESANIGDQIVSKLNCLAMNNKFLYDLKPSNIVLNIEGGLDVRIIDYGRDFCECNSTKYNSEIDINTPVLNMISKITNGDEELIRHIMFAAMLVQLSSTTTRHIYDDRSEHHMGRTDRRNINPFATLTSKFIESMQGKNKTILRNVLRSDGVRSVLRHYHGRRNAGTKRTLQFATGSIC